MRTIKLILSLLVVITMSNLGFSQITGTAHDFSGETWNSSGEICVVCHTPHGGDLTVADAPLWNHQVTGETFQIYTSASFDATNGQPDGSSKLCLSCHDGVTAVDNYANKTNGTDLITGGEKIGTDLRDDHPVSFTYDATLASTDGGLKDPSTANSGLGGTINADMLLGGKLQCASCHDVHNGANLNHLLVKSNNGSGLCLTCHSK